MRTRRDERGAVAILVAVLSLVLFGLAALVVDLGLARTVRAEDQSAADASALAAANELYVNGAPKFADAVATAVKYAQDNAGVTSAEWSSCTDATPLAYQPTANRCVTFDSSTHPTEVRVVIPPSRVSTPLGSLFGIDHVDVHTRAQAAIDGDGLADCGFCIIGTGMNHAIDNGNLALIGGASIAFNGNVCLKNLGLLSVEAPGSVSVEGDALSSNGCKDTSTQYPSGRTEDAGEIEDPLSFLSIPPTAAMAGLNVKGAATNACDPVAGGPGIYGSLNVPNNSTCVLKPGLYVIAGQNHISSGSTVINARGVTLYFTCGTRIARHECAPGEAGGDLLMTGDAALNHTAPKCIAPEVLIPGCSSIKGMAIVADRNNTASFGWRGNGGVLASSGTIYLASGTLDYRGNGSLDALDSLIVVKELMNSGNTVLTGRYTLANNVEVPGGAINLTR